MGHCHILIIDDDREDVEVLSEALKEFGNVHLQQVNTSQQAYQYLETTLSLPQLVVCDMYLLDSIGVTFLSDLQTKDTYKGIQAIILSSTNSEYSRKMYPELKVEFLEKPNTKEGYQKLAAHLMRQLEPCLSPR